MLNAQDILEDLRLISARIMEYVDGEQYRLEYENSYELRADDIVNCCMPILESELREMGIRVELSEREYLSEWSYSEGMIALRKFFDKDRLAEAIALHTDCKYAFDVILTSPDVPIELKVRDILDYCDRFQIGDSGLRSLIHYLDGVIVSTELFCSHVLAVAKSITQKSAYATELDIRQAVRLVKLGELFYQEYSHTLRDLLKALPTIAHYDIDFVEASPLNVTTIFGDPAWVKRLIYLVDQKEADQELILKLKNDVASEMAKSIRDNINTKKYTEEDIIILLALITTIAHLTHIDENWKNFLTLEKYTKVLDDIYTHAAKTHNESTMWLIKRLSQHIAKVYHLILTFEE